MAIDWNIIMLSIAHLIIFKESHCIMKYIAIYDLFDGLAQDCGSPGALVMELPQCCA